MFSGCVMVVRKQFLEFYINDIYLVYNCTKWCGFKPTKMKGRKEGRNVNDVDNCRKKMSC
jgi:hypothetical protein